MTIKTVNRMTVKHLRNLVIPFHYAVFSSLFLATTPEPFEPPFHGPQSLPSLGAWNLVKIGVASGAMPNTLVA